MAKYTITTGSFAKDGSDPLRQTHDSDYEVRETHDGKWAVMCGYEIISVHRSLDAACKKWLRLTKGKPEDRPNKDTWDVI